MISSKDLKFLWGRAAGRCSICRIELSQEKQFATEIFPIGEHAHIVAEQEKSPRGESILSQEERDSYHNLILLCPTCHTLIDKNEEDFPPERLYIMKSEHELWVQKSLAETSDLQRAYTRLKREQLVRFVQEWMEFYGVYQNLHSIIGVLLLEDKTVELFKTDLWSSFVVFSA